MDRIPGLRQVAHPRMRDCAAGNDAGCIEARKPIGMLFTQALRVS
jgi:hypothetical protein